MNGKNERKKAVLEKNIPIEIRLQWNPPDEITIPEWVEQNVRLTDKMSPEPGLLRISRTPYIRGPLASLGHDYVEEVVLVWGRQLSKSTGVQYSFLCYCIAQDPGPATFLLPIRDKALEISETKLQPIFEACEVVRAKKPANPDHYTKARMDFTSMVLAMGWGGSESQTTTRSNRYLFIDEADEIKKKVGQSNINPIKGIIQTTTTFPNRKIIMTSTPTTPEGNIWQELTTCQLVFEYWISCPYCGIMQILYWENVKFGEDHDPIVVEEMAYYECESCKEHISNLDKIRALANGEWRARTTTDPCKEIMDGITAEIEKTISLDGALANKRIKKIGFHLPKWYSPFSGGAIGVIAKEFLEANNAIKEGDDFTPLRNWRIYNAALPWKETVVSETESELAKNIIPISPQILIPETVALTCGIDVGQGGFWFAVLSWKRDMSPHLTHYGWLAGGYEASGIEELVRGWTYGILESEIRLSIWRIGIDTGGTRYSSEDDISMTAAAYDWIRRMRRPGLFGTKGLSHDIIRRLREARIDKMPGDKGALIPGGITLVEINTRAIKDQIWYRIRIPDGKPGRFTFHNETESQFYTHLLAEEKNRESGEWIRKRRANHLLDCVVIAFAMADPEFRGGIRIARRPDVTKPGPDLMGSPVNPVTKRPQGSWMQGRGKSWSPR